MTEKRLPGKEPLGLKPLEYHVDFANIFEPIVIDNPTEQEEWAKKRIMDALNDVPKKKVGYLVMEMKEKGDVE